MKWAHLGVLGFSSLALVAGACGQDGIAAATGAGNDGGNGTHEGGGGAGTGGDGTGGGSGGAAPSGSCVVSKNGTKGTVLRGTLVKKAGISSGEVFIGTDGKIACVGTSCSQSPGYADASIVTCKGPVIAPGLINTHDHTDYNDAPPIEVGKTRWDHRNGWRKGTGGEMELDTPKPSDDDRVVAAAELRFVLGGATSIAGSGGVKGFLRNLAAYPDTSLTEGLAGRTAYFDTFPLNDGSSGKEVPSGCTYTGVTTSGAAFTAGQYLPHFAEGVNAAAENEFVCAAGMYGLITRQTSVIHGVGLKAADIQKIADAGAKLIWSPRSNIALYGNTAEIPTFKALDVPIALGTDWLASGSMNLLRELKCADSVNTSYFGHALSDEDLVAAVTWNGALAAGYSTEIGDLAPGLQGDVTIFAGGKSEYRAVIDAGVEDVLLVLRGGKPLYGEASLISTLTPGCTDLDVCKAKKQVCVDIDGVSLSELQSAASFYPLFFCKDETPDKEPSCTPYRAEYPDGITAADKDGDGIPDATDDCPSVFNPIRPLDGAAQADGDSDGKGDACDATP